MVVPKTNIALNALGIKSLRISVGRPACRGTCELGRIGIGYGAMLIVLGLSIAPEYGPVQPIATAAR